MTKKSLGLILALIVILSGIVLWYFTRTIPISRKNTNIVASSILAPAAPPALVPRVAVETFDSDAAFESPNNELHGKDFTVNITDDGALYKNLNINLNDGKSINELVRADGSTTNLEKVLFSSGNVFELKRLLPNIAREQLIIKGSAVLTDGYGIVKDYSVYRIDDTKLTELINLVTERDFSGAKGQSALKLTGTVTDKEENGKFFIIYRYRANQTKFQTILFQWNGSRFVDPSGQYEKLNEKYRP